MKKINLLMTGGGAPGAAGIIHCLRQFDGLRIIAADAYPNAIGKYIADDFETIPFATDSNFSNRVIRVCHEKKVDLLLPLVTKELIPLGLITDRLKAAGTQVLISDLSSLEIANDKSKLYQFLEWRGIQVPDFRVVENIDQFKIAVSELGYPAKEVCFKPSVSNGSRGFRVISGKIDELDLLLNHKPDATFISFENAERILSTGKFPELLVSEFLPGDEYSVDCLAKNGETILVLPRLRRKMIGGISVEGEFVRNDEINDYCASIIRELKLHGNIGIQVKQALAGQFLLLEINPRVQGTISAALGAGVNLPLLAVKQEMGLPIQASELEIKWGTRFSRHWSEIFY